MVVHYILVYKYKEANRVYSVVKIMCLGVFPCDNLTAKCCIINRWHEVYFTQDTLIQ